MGKRFFDIQPFFSKLVNTKQYSSGTLYKAFDIIPRSDVDIHNALGLFIIISISPKGNFNYEKSKTR